MITVYIGIKYHFPYWPIRPIPKDYPKTVEGVLKLLLNAEKVTFIANHLSNVYSEGDAYKVVFNDKVGSWFLLSNTQFAILDAERTEDYIINHAKDYRYKAK